MKKAVAAITARRTHRFAIVGVGNAAISFGVLNLAFYMLHVGKIPASIIATTCALIFSFVMNRNFVFGDHSQKAHKQAVPFVIVTITGTLLVLNTVYIITLNLLQGHEQPLIDLVHSLTGVTLHANFIDINVSTVVGAVFAMVWNYNGYRLFVFKGVKEQSNVEEESDRA